MSYFSPQFFDFLRDLKASNDRVWFADNRARYVEDVEAPMLAFIGDVGPRLRHISAAYVADRRKVGGSMFRIYRDTRFSHDKSPFKTWIAARFSHEARKKQPDVPGFYIHLGLDELFGGGGVYHVERPALTRIRQRIVDMPDAWTAVRRTVEVQGEQLKRGPAGFPATHPHIEDLKRQNFYALTTFSQPQVVAPDFLDRYTHACEAVAPLVEFETRAMGLRW
jgi:uncharacterized protein (TIGR02453 family)